MLPDEDKRALALVRYEHALECLRAANALFAADDLKGAVNRAYYAVFHAMRSVLALDEIDRKHHSAIIAEFRSRYVKTGVFEAANEELLKHYIATLHAEFIGITHDFHFIIDEVAAKSLLEVYHFEWNKS